MPVSINWHGDLSFPDKNGAVFSNCGRYRYRLWRTFRYTPINEIKTLAVVTLNPSIADERLDDHTIRCCMHAAKANGFTRVSVYNLYAYICSSSNALFNVISLNPGLPEDFNVGPENDRYLSDLAESGDLVLCAWGHAAKKERVRKFWEMFHLSPTVCLNTNKNGSPKSLSYSFSSGNYKLIPYNPIEKQAAM